ncbi:hypothetical protein FA13DRAFT_1175739 [Coprinellus micaceus]|uniref:Uncharacterized protein n=1 Tax=Coprinellus micaceus TaxID=71717 RepID=A0A4Y7STQ2_COPMI|nr:hypothetical protein FA13DRAFT_1175739 [Coprinellus micaceus]
MHLSFPKPRPSSVDADVWASVYTTWSIWSSCLRRAMDSFDGRCQGRKREETGWEGCSGEQDQEPASVDCEIESSRRVCFLQESTDTRTLQHMEPSSATYRQCSNSSRGNRVPPLNTPRWTRSPSSPTPTPVFHYQGDDMRRPKVSLTAGLELEAGWLRVGLRACKLQHLASATGAKAEASRGRSTLSFILPTTRP